MASLGYYLLLAAFVVCAYAHGGIGGRRAPPLAAPDRKRHRRLLPHRRHHGGRLVGHRLRLRRPATTRSSTSSATSDSVQPLFYKITSYWGGLDGSIMFWVFLLSVFGSAAVYVNRERHRELIPYVVAVISVVQMFFLFLMVVHNNPFETYLTETPDRRRRAEPAAPELLHGDPSAHHVPRVRRPDDPVRLRHGGADHRATWTTRGCARCAAGR